MTVNQNKNLRLEFRQANVPHRWRSWHMSDDRSVTAKTCQPEGTSCRFVIVEQQGHLADSNKHLNYISFPPPTPDAFLDVSQGAGWRSCQKALSGTLPTHEGDMCCGTLALHLEL